ncbi:hypothetical protein ACTA71_005225 [Dictyostelium dimigraforme]
MINRYDKKFYKPEDELSNLTDGSFDRLIKYITAFEVINAQIEPALTIGRQIELFIRGINDISIKIAIDEANPKSLDEAINVARLKANSKYKCENISYYNAVNKGIIAPVEQQLEQPTRVKVPTTGNFNINSY